MNTLRQFESEIEAARAAEGEAHTRFAADRERAVSSALRTRDLLYCQREGLLDEGDDLLACAVAEDQEARRQLRQSSRELARAGVSVEIATRRLEEERRRLEAETEEKWMRKHHPDLVTELEEAEREFDELTDESTPEARRDLHSVGRSGQIERARQRVSAAREEYKRALEAKA